MTARMKPTATAPLLYWLVVVAGLVGYSVLRARTPASDLFDVASDVAPIWIGTIGGAALGQLVAFLRVRAWVPVATVVILTFGPGLWLLSAFWYYLRPVDNATAEAALMAFAPAAISGYLALSARGALVSFWYPATLWMVAILDSDGSPDAFDRRAALPLVVGLGALFVSFLHARQTRTVALWARHADDRLGEVRSRTVLRASPLRSLSEHLGFGVVSAVSLVLAAWVAPQLWQVEKIDGPTEARPSSSSSAGAGAEPHAACCEELVTKKVRRVSEYLPVRNAKQAEERLLRESMCLFCSERARVTVPQDMSGYASWSEADSRDVSTYASSAASGDGTIDPVANSYPLPAEPTYPTYPTYVPPVTTPAPPLAPMTAPEPPPAPEQVAARPVGQASTPFAPPVASPASKEEAKTLPPSAPARDAGPPWRWSLVLCGAFLAAHAAIRALRRALVLRHLDTPFWPESVDQRISNSWERMLIGLRDAGIVPMRDEQPTAFAKRVGLEGMDTCAKILERVRHGVGVQALDVATMGSASGTVYAAARRRAGALARAVAWLRWPLA